MAGRPRLLRFIKKEATSARSGTESIFIDWSDASTGVAGHVSIRPRHATTEALARRFFTSTHLAPSFVSRGGTAIRLQRSFQLAPEFLATTRQSGFHCSHADVERGRDLLVGKAFDIS